jgi:hypothetical protein
MCSVARRAPQVSLGFFVLALIAAAALPGCSGEKSEKQRLDAFYTNNPAPKRGPTAKFAGRVSIDNSPPEKDATMFVVLHNPAKLEKLGRLPPKYYTMCDENGAFDFAGGVPTGKWVVTFAVLHQVTKGAGRLAPGEEAVQQFVGPDGLKNLYNDPVKNQNDPTFVIDVQDPGKTDHEFNLPVGGKESDSTPGEYAVTRVTAS